MTEKSIPPVTPPSPTPSTTSSTPAKGFPLRIGVLLVAAALIVWAALTFFPGNMNTSLPEDPVLEPQTSLVPETFDNPSANLQALKSTLSKEKFLKKLFSINRETYQLYEKAGEYLELSPEQVQLFFFECCDLTQESDIYSELPSFPSDFSEVAYAVSVGNLYQIGSLSENVYKQPEFYTFIDQETGIVNREYAFKGWSEPQLDQWVDHGIQVYPSDQYDTLDLSSDRKSFRAVVFVTNVWNNQNYLGVQMVPNHEAMECFDLTITEEKTGQPYFLLGPTFPRFDKDWATRVIVEGTLKPGVGLGECTVSLNPVAPPSELSTKWSDDYPGRYIPYGFLRPSDNYVNLHISITE